MNKILLLGSIPVGIIILYLCLFDVQAQENSPYDQTVELNYCSTTANYTSNSPFQTNLNRLLSSLVANGTRSGYYNDTIGTAPDTVYGLVNCRGDLSMQECGTCLNTLRVNITQNCPIGRDATLRSQPCLLRYSNLQFFSQVDSSYYGVRNPTDTVADTDAARYNQQLGSLMKNLSETAMYRESRYYSGSIDFTDFNDIYGMAWCTRDLSPTSCFSCLHSLITFIPGCCNRTRSARIFSSTCTVRYALNPFLNALELPPPSPPPINNSPPPPIDDSPPQPNGIGGDGSTNIVAIVVPVVGGGLLLLAVCAYLIIRRSNSTKRKPGIIYDQDDVRSEDSLQFNFNTIRIATNDFSDANKLGEGGFGAVYVGELLDGQEIAVKRLSKNSGQGSQEFKNEVVLLHKLQHRNLVRLLGFCLAGEEKLLIYEYIPNISLDKYIFDPTKKALLDWGRRYKIIIGITRGLLYLHQDSRLRVIHRDLKPGNILLDEEMNAKIADFGMAKLFGVDQSHGNTKRIAGTFGYMAPEYAGQGLFSVKSDVFSFGVLVLEIISGQKTNNFSHSGFSRHLLSYAWKLWREGDALKLMDPTLRESYRANEVMRCIHIGLLCVQQKLDDRPTMSSVVLMIDSYTLKLNSPSAPAFILETTTGANDSIKDVDFNKSTTRSLHSRDGISLSYPR